MSPTKSSVLRRAATAALAVWLGGVYCLFCCASGTMTVAASDLASESEDSCTAHACCHLKSDAEDQTKVISSSEEAKCCPLVGQAAVLTEKRSGFGISAATLAVNPALPAPQNLVDETIVISRLHIPDRGGTYLLCCLFLI